MTPPLPPPQEAALREAARGAAAIVLSPSTVQSLLGELDRLRTKLSAAGLLYREEPAVNVTFGPLQPTTPEDLL